MEDSAVHVEWQLEGISVSPQLFHQWKHQKYVHSRWHSALSGAGSGCCSLCADSGNYTVVWSKFIFYFLFIPITDLSVTGKTGDISGDSSWGQDTENGDCPQKHLVTLLLTDWLTVDWLITDWLFTDWLTDWLLTDWLIDYWLTDCWLTDWLTDCLLTDWLKDWLTDCWLLTDWLTDWLTEMWKNGISVGLECYSYKHMNIYKDKSIMYYRCIQNQ